MKNNNLFKFAKEISGEMNSVDKTSLQALHDVIMEASVVTVVAHTHPDGDAIGSTIAMRAYLRMLGKDAEIILPESVGDNLRFMVTSGEPLSGEDDIQAAKTRIGASDLIICQDCNSFHRTGCLESMLYNSLAKKVLIDHHIGPEKESFNLIFSKCEISSASELLFWILMEMPEIDGDAAKLPSVAADALMTGMTTDTNNFANSVYPSTLDMASKLLAAGVDRDRIVAMINNMYRENRLRLMGWMLKDDLTITDNGVAYTILTADVIDRYSIREGETEGFVNIPLAVEKVRMSILVKADGDHYRVSIRSKKGTSANLCSNRYFNGGGHEQAAGGKLFCPKDIASMDRKDVADYIEKVTSEFFR